MNRIGFIGLGTMGLPMATNLLQKGHHVTVYNRTKNKTSSLVELGAKVAESPRELASECDFVFTILSADAAVEEVMFGENGLIYGAHPGLVLIDSSTISPATSKRIARKFEPIDVETLDAPVTGSEPQAIAGVLTFMVGGKREVFERCQILFESMGQKAYYMGDHGAGSYTKLANNTMAAINLLSYTEALVMAVKSGIDPTLFTQVVSGGGARSGMAENKGQKMIERDFRANFSTALMSKDLDLATDLAKELQIPVPVLTLVSELLRISMSSGFAAEDIAAVVKCYEMWAGVTIEKQN